MDGKPCATDGASSSPQELLGVLDITVLMGGPSSERDVSLMSGTAIADALGRVGHEITRADIDPTDTSALGRDGIDLVFIALHGEFGESGEVQGLCEERQLRYTGTRQRGSSLAMDKAASKQICIRAGLATPEWMIIEDFHSPAQVAKWVSELPPPVVVKPVDSGSSVDITIARDERVRDEALEAVLDKYSRAMIEQFVPGRELTVGILGSQALPVIEIIPSRAFYDYTAKYADNSGTRYELDPDLDASILSALEADALTAHNAIGCRHMSRVDFILDEDGGRQFLEINTIPGFTSHSLLPMAAEKAGLGFDQLVNRIAALAMTDDDTTHSGTEG